MSKKVAVIMGSDSDFPVVSPGDSQIEAVRHPGGGARDERTPHAGGRGGIL